VARGDLITTAVIDKAHRAGLQVVVWTINEVEQMRQLIATGVDGIITDYPDRLLGLLQESEK
jgi:glycerophosphoryl diester phosphodiesterase